MNFEQVIKDALPKFGDPAVAPLVRSLRGHLTRNVQLTNDTAANLIKQATVHEIVSILEELMYAGEPRDIPVKNIVTLR